MIRVLEQSRAAVKVLMAVTRCGKLLHVKTLCIHTQPDQPPSIRVQYHKPLCLQACPKEQSAGTIIPFDSLGYKMQDCSK